MALTAITELTRWFSILTHLDLSKLTIGMECPSFNFKLGIGVGMFAIFVVAIPAVNKRVRRLSPREADTDSR